jgi:hypothetical protein
MDGLTARRAQPSDEIYQKLSENRKSGKNPSFLLKVSKKFENFPDYAIMKLPRKRRCIGCLSRFLLTCLFHFFSL